MEARVESFRPAHCIGRKLRFLAGMHSRRKREVEKMHVTRVITAKARAFTPSAIDPPVADTVEPLSSACLFG